MSEISEDMIHKAAVVISELRESEKGFIFSSRIAEAALEAAGVAELAARIAELGAELAKHQESSFHPDWSLLETTRESLRKAQAREARATEFGFNWGAAEVSRLFSDDAKGSVTIGIKTPKGEIQVYVTKTGKIRVHDKSGAEWKPIAQGGASE